MLLLRRPPKKPIYGFGRRKNKKAAEKKKLGGEQNCGAENLLGGYLAAEHHYETAPKKKQNDFFRLGAEKYDFRPPKEQRPSNFISRPSWTLQMRSTVFPELLRTAKDKLHSPRPRIAGLPINVLCHSMMLNFVNSFS